MGKGSNTTSQSGTSSVSPDSNAYQAYLKLLNQAQGVASTPYQGYTGEETAPINAQQQTGISDINQAQGNIAGMGPISSADIQKYQDPYTNDVINATQADFDTQNQRANSTVTGNAAAQGALGGDRVGVAQALTAEGQARVQAPVIAGLRSSGYQQAVNTAENQQKFDLTAQQAAAQGAGQQVGAGTLQQTTQQNQDTQARQDYYQQQGYPFQVAQWLASIDTGVGGSMGSSSTSSGTSQGPTPNPWTQAAGLGLTAASMFIKDGGRVTGKRAGFAAGGMPWAGSDTWVPTASIHAAAPTAHANLPSAPPAQKAGLSPDQMKGIGVLGKQGAGLFDSASYGGGNFMTDAYGGSSSSPLDGLSAADYGTGYHGGGRIRRYASGGFADGGSPDFSDRFDAAFPNMAAGVGSSRPAFEDVGPTYDDGAGPFRLSAPEDLDAWRGRVDRDNGRKIGVAAKEAGLPPPTMVASAPDEVSSLPSEVTAGVSKRRMTASAAPADTADEGTEALGYAGAPRMQPGVGAPQNLTATEQEKPGGILNSLGIKMSPELRQGLMQAGLSMMATTRGGPGSFLGSLGEAGMAGVGGYEKSQQAALKQAQTEREQAIEAEKLRMTQETHQQQMAAAPILADGRVNPAYVNKLKAEEDVKSYKPQLVHHTDPATGAEQYFTYDANTQKMAPVEIPTTGEAKDSGKYVSQAAPVADRRKAPAASPDARDEGYIQWLDSHRPPGYSDLVRGVADYEMDPNRVASLQKGQREQLYRDVKTFDPTYDQTHFGEKSGVIASFSRGADRAAVNSLNVSVSHLGTLQKLGDALQNGNTPLINRIGNQIAIQLGRPAPVNFDAAKEIVGDEVVKAVVGGVNSQADREAVKHLIMAQQSPAQLKGVIQTFISLLGGQLEGRRQGYQAGTGLNNFDQKYLSPETQEALKSSSGTAAGSDVMRAVYPSGLPKPATAAPTTGGGFTPPSGAIARDYNGKTYYYDPNTKQPYPGQ